MLSMGVSAQDELFDEHGYRIAWMRSPTPQLVDGAITLSVDELLVKMNSDEPPLLLDVLPLTWMGIWVEIEPHRSLPGAIWLPNVGRAELEPIWSAYLDQHLAEKLNGDKDAELIVFCRADCWYSWNTVKRLVERGYTSLYWYRLGTDGWLESGLALEDVHPEPVQEVPQRQ